MRASSNVADACITARAAMSGTPSAPLLGSAPAAKGAVTAASQR